MTQVPPSPVPASHARVFLAKPLPGSAWRDLLEPLLVRMPREDADRTMMLLEESRGAWALLLPGATRPPVAPPPRVALMPLLLPHGPNTPQ